MKLRPTSVTVISWILIVMGAMSLVVIALMFNNPAANDLMSRNPLPATLQYVMMYAGLLVTIISGYAMLKGRNWARLLYVIWSAIGFVVGVATSPMKTAMIPGFLIYLVFVIFLFCPKANQYFSGSEVESAPENH
jgi:hypothetical protein